MTTLLRRLLRTGLSAVTSGLVIWFLVHQGALQSPSRWIPGAIDSLGARRFALLSLLPLVGLASAVTKWYVILAETTLLRAATLHWASEFASLFGLGSLGGDGFKVAWARDRKATIGQVLVIRGVGLFSNVVLLVLIFFLSFRSAVLVGLALIGALLFHTTHRASPTTLLTAKLVSITLAETGLSVMILRSALNEISRFGLDVVATLHIASLLASAIPLSYQGIGFRETAFNLVGANALGNGPVFAEIGAALSIMTIAVRALGVVPLHRLITEGR